MFVDKQVLFILLSCVPFKIENNREWEFPGEALIIVGNDEL